MNRSFITYYRDNKQLHTSKLNGFPFVSFGVPVGQINGVTCFESVTITTGGKRERVVTADDFGGPVSICVETKGQPPQWFGLADQLSTEQFVSTPDGPTGSGLVGFGLAGSGLAYVQEISA